MKNITANLASWFIKYAVSLTCGQFSFYAYILQSLQADVYICKLFLQAVNPAIEIRILNITLSLDFKQSRCQRTSHGSGVATAIAALRFWDEMLPPLRHHFLNSKVVDNESSFQCQKTLIHEVLTTIDIQISVFNLFFYSQFTSVEARRVYFLI